MPQVFQVLRCYKCLVFQVHQTKKSNKWQCKLCGEKQSVKRHYGVGNGKDCRLHVQKLNKMRGDEEELIETIVESDDEDLICEHNIIEPKPSRIVIKNSKWNAYIDQMIDEEYNNESYSDGDKYPLVNSHKRKDKRRKYSEVKTEDSNDNEQITYTLNNSIDINVPNTFPDNVSKYTSCPVIKPISNTDTINHSTSMKNSKWVNYLEENEQLPNINNESIYLPDKDNTISENGSKTIHEYNDTVPLFNRKIKSKQNFTENTHKVECIREPSDGNCNKNKDDKYNVNSSNDFPKCLHLTDNRTDNQLSMFTLCEDNDLDRILNI